MEDYLDRESSWQQFWRLYKGIILVGSLGIGLLMWGTAYYYGEHQELHKSVVIDMSTSTALGSVVSSSSQIYVDVSGAVETPGLAIVQDGARVGDVLERVGGMVQNADIDWVDLHINLARKVKDGDKIYIPFKDDTMKDVSSMQKGIGVSINHSSEDELIVLEGIGEVTAGKIIKGRPYKQVEDLLDLKILSRKVYDLNKDKLVL